MPSFGLLAAAMAVLLLQEAALTLCARPLARAIPLPVLGMTELHPAIGRPGRTLQGCTDRLKWCDTWHSTGYCEPKWQYNTGSSVGLQPVATYWCPLTCGICKAPTAKSPKPPAGAGAAHLLLAEHNALRARHGAPALAWDAGLETKAKAWARNCMFKAGAPSGENLSATGGLEEEEAAASAVAKWYGEAGRYSFPGGQYSPAASHFTQLVWKGSARVGCAIAECSSQLFSSWPNPQYFVVCRYDPPGNAAGKFRQNVFPASPK